MLGRQVGVTSCLVPGAEEDFHWEPLNAKVVRALDRGIQTLGFSLKWG